MDSNLIYFCPSVVLTMGSTIFQTAIEEAKSHNPREIILNFSKVLSINSAGLGIILVAKQKMPDEYCKLKIAAPKGNVLDVLELANIGKSISITVL